ncbi:MAG: phospholipid carrier-dependent glycosyltransferase [Flavobacteriales bacterium]
MVIISPFVLVLTLLIFLPRLLSLSEHWASDESLWMERSRDFFFALHTRHFADTYITHHPGVTTCWLGSTAIWNKYRQDGFSRSWFHSAEFLSPEMLASIRFPIAVATGILILVAGGLLYRLFAKPMTAGLSTLFLAIEPFLLAESRRTHTDALTSLFLFLSLLLWLCYLESESLRRRDIILSGICFAFACLTKSLAGAFLLFLPLLFGWYIKQRGVPWVKIFWSAILWMMTTVLTVLVAWPYMWTVTFNLWNLPMFPVLFIGSGILLIWSFRKLMDSPSVLTRTELLILGYGLFMTVGGVLSAVVPVIGGMYGATTMAHPTPTLFLGEIRYNPTPLFFPVMWFVWSTPLTLPLMGVAVYHAWKQKRHTEKTFRVVVVLSLFVLFYLIGLSIVAKKISRYIVVFLPSVSLLTALGAVQVAQLFKKRRMRYIFLAAVILLQIAPILRLHPYYRAYYYPLLSGKWVSQNTSSITGAGLDLAADYLNALPNAQHLRIQLSSLFTEDLAHYFVGHATLRGTTDTPSTLDYEVEHLYDKQIQGTPVDPPPTNYMQPYKWQPSPENARELEHVVRLNGIDYVWIYRILPPEAAPD